MFKASCFCLAVISMNCIIYFSRVNNRKAVLACSWHALWIWHWQKTALQSWIVCDRKRYFGLGPIPKLKPKLANTFNRCWNHISKVVANSVGHFFSHKRANTVTNTKIGPWFRFSIRKPGFGRTLIFNDHESITSETKSPLQMPFWYIHQI